MSLAQPKPSFLIHHVFKKTLTLNHSLSDSWLVLNTMETFTKGQVFPFRVEFVAEKAAPSFETGVWTNHHGPLLNVCGQIGRMKVNEYRDLNYSYGSYVLSFRLIRPVRLQFYFKEMESGCEVTVQFDSYVVPWLSFFWTFLQSLFWNGFSRRLSRKSIHKD